MEKQKMNSFGKIKEMLAIPSDQADITWVFCGDSITHGVNFLDDYRDYTELFQIRMRGELSRDWDAVIRTAVNGWNTTTILNSDNLSSLVEAQHGIFRR